MKKIALTSLLAISVVAPAMASIWDANIVIERDASNAPCTSTTLNTPTGPAALEAEWAANTIKINWDAKNGTNATTNYCTYDSTLTLPATPSKPGYTFGGWTVKIVSGGGAQNESAQCSLSGLDASIDGSDYGSVDEDYFKGSAVVAYGLTEGGDYAWGVTFSYGIVKGEALCSNTGGTYAQTGTPNETKYSGNNCWCRATSYAATGSDMCAVSSPVWVFYTDSFEDYCSIECAYMCADNIQNNSVFRAAVFGQSN